VFDVFAMQDVLNSGQHSFQEIADMFGVTISEVDDVFMDMINQEAEFDLPDYIDLNEDDYYGNDEYEYVH
jgi:hypothetical protein